MKISRKYKPLFELLDNQHKEVDTVIITGGRFSGKSYGVGLFTAESFIQYDWKVLYTRFTNTSVKDSIITEFDEKLDVNDYRSYCETLGDRVNSTCGDGQIVFKGIKTGSGNQTANLKSLSGFNCFIVDEAEEIPDFETFQKVYFSIRSSKKRNLSILILNPTIKEHWIYKKYYKNNVKKGFNGIKDNVLYIHTSYLDVEREFIPDNIYNSFERLKIEDRDSYNHIVLGGWIEYLKGAVFTSLQRVEEFNESYEYKFAYIDVAQSGTDYLCMVICGVEGNKIHIIDVVMSQEDTNITIPLCESKIKEHKPSTIWIESNNAGGTFAHWLYSNVKDSHIIPINNSANKETRIIADSWMVIKHCLFATNYKQDSDYDIFVEQIKSFNRDKKLNDFDDAPDALTGLCRMLYYNYPHIFE